MRYYIFLILTLVVGLSTQPIAYAQSKSRKTLLLLDLEAPKEMDTIIHQLGLDLRHPGYYKGTRTPCPNNADFCDDNLNIYRPLQKYPDLRDGSKVQDWLRNQGIKNVDALFVSGHHSSGFWGTDKAGYVSYTHLLPQNQQPNNNSGQTECEGPFCKTTLFWGLGCNTMPNYPGADDPKEKLSQLLRDCEEGKKGALSAIDQLLYNTTKKGISLWHKALPQATIIGYDGTVAGTPSSELIKQLFAAARKLPNNANKSNSEIMFELIESSEKHEDKKATEHISKILRSFNHRKVGNATFNYSCPNSQCTIGSSDNNISEKNNLYSQAYELLGALLNANTKYKCCNEASALNVDALEMDTGKDDTRIQYDNTKLRIISNLFHTLYLQTTNVTTDEQEEQFHQLLQPFLNSADPKEKALAYRFMSGIRASNDVLESAIVDIQNSNTNPQVKEQAYLLASRAPIESPQLLDVALLGLQEKSDFIKMKAIDIVQTNVGAKSNPELRAKWNTLKNQVCNLKQNPQFTTYVLNFESATGEKCR